MLKKLFLIICLIFCISIFAEKELNKPIIFNSPKNPITVTEKHPIFTITLPATPSTGFSWALKKYNQKIITFTTHRYFPSDNKKIMGAPGYDVWKFEVKKAAFKTNQTTKITMQYTRPWTKKQSMSQVFTVMATGSEKQ